MSNPIAYWDIGLDIECPACKEWVDLLRTDDFWEGRSFNPIEHHTHRTENVEVVCPECDHKFIVDFDF